MMSNFLLPVITIPTKIDRGNHTPIDNIFTYNLNPDTKSGNFEINLSDRYESQSVSNDCLFNKQVNSVIEKGKNTMSWILQTFKTRSLTPMLTLYKSLLLSILELSTVLPFGVHMV